MELIGKTMEVLVDRKTKDGKKMRGRTRCWQKAAFDGDLSLIGSLQQVQINGVSSSTLLGQIEARTPLLA